jgi:hypothetical protein
MLAGSKVQHLEREEFKGAQQLSAAVKQERGVGPGEVYENLRLLPVAILRERRVDDNAVFEAKAAMSDDGLKELIDLIGGSNFVHKKLSAISRQLSANGPAVFFLGAKAPISARLIRGAKTPLFHESLFSKHETLFNKIESSFPHS